MILGSDIGFGVAKTVTRSGADAFPSVVGDWTPTEVLIGGGFDRTDLEALGYQGRQYLVGERALKLARRLFVGLSREWLDTVPHRSPPPNPIPPPVADSRLSG